MDGCGSARSWLLGTLFRNIRCDLSMQSAPVRTESRRASASRPDVRGAALIAAPVIGLRESSASVQQFQKTIRKTSLIRELAQNPHKYSLVVFSLDIGVFGNLSFLFLLKTGGSILRGGKPARTRIYVDAAGHGTGGISELLRMSRRSIVNVL